MRFFFVFIVLLLTKPLMAETGDFPDTAVQHPFYEHLENGELLYRIDLSCQENEECDIILTTEGKTILNPNAEVPDCTNLNISATNCDELKNQLQLAASAYLLP